MVTNSTITARGAPFWSAELNLTVYDRSAYVALGRGDGGCMRIMLSVRDVARARKALYRGGIFELHSQASYGDRFELAVNPSDLERALELLRDDDIEIQTV
jgi:hypothetical protein